MSLLIAAIQLRGISENLHVVVFLRSEIFDLLKPHLAQLDKIRTDIETLHWSLRDLTNLTVTRALDSLDITADIQAEMALYLLFPGAVDNSGLGVFDYLLSRTSLRPREVIQFCNLALQIASDSGGSAITFDSIVQAEEQFSSWKLEYVIAENMFIYPGLDILLERFRGGAKHQARQAIDSLLTEIVLEYSEKSPPPGWCKPGIEPDELLDILYSIEVLGIERPPARSTDSRHIWTQYDFVFSRPNGKPEDSASFLFHPGLWKALDLH